MSRPNPAPKPQKKGEEPEDFGAVVILLALRHPNQPPGWAYVAVPSSKAADLVKLAGKPVDPEAFGKVLLQGEGASPPPEAREYIFEQYGFDS